MDLKQLEYIVAIADEQSISKAAEKLYMTQSALNQQLLRLERELGVSLFNRIRHSMLPTYAGNVYLDNARKMLYMKEETYKILHDIADMKKGEISVAYTPERGSVMFSNVYPKFHRLYPDITFKIHESRVKKTEQLVAQGSVSIGFVAHTEEKPEFTYYPQQPELMVLALPASHPLAYMAGEESYRTFPHFDLKLLENDYFALMTHETRFRDSIDDAFAKAGYKPKVLFESTSTYTIFNMVKNQVCPTFFPQSYVEPGAPIVYFSFGSRLSWMRSAITRKGAYLSKPEMDFLELAKNYTINGPEPDSFVFK